MYNGTLSNEELFLTIQKLERKIDALQELIQASKNKPNEEWMTVKQLHEYLPSRPSVSTIHRWTSTGEIPTHKSGRRLCFLKSEIDQWLESRSTKTKANILTEAEQYYNQSVKAKSAPWRCL